MMALDGKTIIKEEITDGKDGYDSATATTNTNRRNKTNSTSSNNKESVASTTVSALTTGLTTNGSNNNSSSNNNSNSSSTANGSRTPDSPESTRVIAPRSPMSPQLHHSSLALAPPPMPLQPTRPNRNASASPITSSPPPPPPQPTSAATLAHVEQARLLGKIRKFLGSLVQLAQEVHPDASERVRALVLSLASGGITIDEFRLALQEIINLPLRPYVIPLLKNHIALLQREIAALARATNQTTLQYVTTNENAVMEFTAHGPNPEYSDIFVQLDAAQTNSNGGSAMVFKRRSSDSMMESHHNGLQEWNEYMSAAKRIHTAAYNPQLAHSMVAQPTLFDYSTSGSGMPSAVAAAAAESQSFVVGLTEKLNHRDERDMRSDAPRHPVRTAMPSAGSGVSGATVGGGSSAGGAANSGEEEWKNIHTMLNCISAMVDKTKRAITILQQRGIEPQQPNFGEITPAAFVEIRRQTEEKVAEFKRNAEEAVNQVKRQAVIEIQRAVVNAETRASEAMVQERLRMEKFFLEISRERANEREREREREVENKSPSITGGQNACWNCGRKATETCSGCNLARYCGPFCQHKDWEHHHQICGTTRSTDLSTKHASQVIPLTANIRSAIAARSPPTPSVTASHTQPTQNQTVSGGGSGGSIPTSSLVPNGVGSK